MHADSPGLNLKCPLQAREFEHLARAGGGHLRGCGAWLGERPIIWVGLSVLQPGSVLACVLLPGLLKYE